MGQRATQSTNQTSTTQLPAGQQANVNELMSGALSQYQSGGPKFFPGQTFAGPTAQETAGRTAASGYATGVGQSLVDSAIKNDQFFLNPDNVFNVGNTPGYGAVRQGIVQDTTRNLTESILPGIRGSAITGGGLGGSRQGIAEGLAVGRTNDALSKNLGALDMSVAGMNMQANQAAAARAPQTFALGLQPAQTQANVGAAIRGDTQQSIDANRERFNFEQMAPLLNLQALQSLTGTAGQYGGTTTSQGQQGVNDGGAGVTQALGTALALFALSSHSSYKKDIIPVEGTLAKLSQLDIKTWKYKDEDTSHIGPMAEDFHRVFGVGDGRTINLFDVLGVLLSAVKELADLSGVAHAR
jgi:hypothetical protein